MLTPFATSSSGCQPSTCACSSTTFMWRACVPISRSDASRAVLSPTCSRPRRPRPRPSSTRATQGLRDRASVTCGTIPTVFASGSRTGGASASGRLTRPTTLTTACPSASRRSQRTGRQRSSGGWARPLPDARPADGGGTDDGDAPVPLRMSPGFRVGLSIAVATGLYGVSFGALGVAAGLTVPQTIALSLLMFTGGSQFAFIGVVAGGGSGAAAAAAASLLGIRNAVYGMQMNAILAPRGWRRFVAALVTIDESIATASGQRGPAEQSRGFWTAGFGIFVLWNIFTAVGAFAGNALGDPKQWGLDGAAVAAFLGLLWPRLK